MCTMYIACGGDAHILRNTAKYMAADPCVGCGGLRCTYTAGPMYKACEHDAQIHRSTSSTYSIMRSTSQQIVKISEFYVDIYAILW